MTSTTTTIAAAIFLFLASGIVCLAIPAASKYEDGYADALYQRAKRDSGLCPERYGRFPDPRQCDAYIECEDGVPQEKLCPDGLLFDPKKRYTYPCVYPVDADCDGRPNRQPGEPTANCPHQYGYFKVEGKNCGTFVNCVAGHAHIFHCPEGLAFNNQTYRCDWPDQVPDCNAEAYLGFHCPEDPAGRKDEIRVHRDKHQCQNYFVCFNGQPRLQKCPDGKAFDEFTESCRKRSEVVGCDDYIQEPIENESYLRESEFLQ